MLEPVLTGYLIIAEANNDQFTAKVGKEKQLQK